MLFSPTAADVDRQIMAVKISPPAEIRDDEEAATSAGYWHRLEAMNERGERRLLGAPHPDKLARHIRLYGSDGVEEIVRAFPTDPLPLAAYRTTAPSGRRMTDEMRRVIHTFGVDHPVSAIANTLNISERRVKEELALSA